MTKPKYTLHRVCLSDEEYEQGNPSLIGVISQDGDGRLLGTPEDAQAILECLQAGEYGRMIPRYSEHFGTWFLTTEEALQEAYRYNPHEFPLEEKTRQRFRAMAQRNPARVGAQKSGDIWKFDKILFDKYISEVAPSTTADPIVSFDILTKSGEEYSVDSLNHLDKVNFHLVDEVAIFSSGSGITHVTIDGPDSGYDEYKKRRSSGEVKMIDGVIEIIMEKFERVKIEGEVNF